MPRLTEQKILAVGVELVRERGVDALGVRAVADRLGVTPMALYRYVPNGEHLRAAVIDRILDDLPRARKYGAPRARLREWALAARSMLHGYPGLARYLLLHWFESAAALDVVESLLEVVAGADLDGFACVAAENAVFMYVLMRVEAETSVRAARVVNRKLGPVRSNPARYPLVRRYESEFTTARLDDHFVYGLDALLRNVAETVPAP